jgi:ABC-type lipoprotein release transport system permease subunit
MLTKTAFKNIIGAGKRTWLNVFVLSFTMVIMVGFNGLIDGWVEEARTETMKWEVGEGQFHHPAYDRYDIFTLQDAHGKAPDELTTAVRDGAVVPVLIAQASIYPQGRMMNVMLKGIDAEQKILALPGRFLQQDGANEIPVIIGERMATSADLSEGDRVMLRWRDKNGVFDAREVIVAHVFSTKTPAVDVGQMWIGLDALRQMTGMKDEATYFVKSAAFPLNTAVGEWPFRDLKFLLADVDEMEKGAMVESNIVFILLLSLALLAVFDTQTLSIFRRQKEIGTYVALGMTPRQVIALFTLEGTCYSILAILAGIVWGAPLLFLFAKYGFAIPGGLQNMGIPAGEAMYPAYHFSTIAISLIVIVVLSALISYLPARKIARQNIVYALKGKIQ